MYTPQTIHQRQRAAGAAASGIGPNVLLGASIVMALCILASQSLPMFSIRESRADRDREIVVLSLWGAVAWLFSREHFFWGIPLLLCSGLWPYARLLLMTLTASPKAVLLVPAQRRRRLAILRDLGTFSMVAPCMLLVLISTLRVDYPGPSGWTETATLVGGHLFCTAMILLEVTNSFNAGSGRAVEDYIYTKQCGETEEAKAARQLRVAGMSAWILMTDIALAMTLCWPCFKVSYVVEGSTASRDVSILDSIQTAWDLGHSLGELNRPVAIAAAAGLVVIPAFVALSVTCMWFLGAGGEGEPRRRTGFYLQELYGFGALGVFLFVVAIARLRSSRITRELNPAIQSLVITPGLGFYVGCVVAFSLWMLVPRVAGIGSTEGGDNGHWDHEWAEAFTPRVHVPGVGGGGGDPHSVCGPVDEEGRPLVVQLPTGQLRVMGISEGTAAQPADRLRPPSARYGAVP